MPMIKKGLVVFFSGLIVSLAGAEGASLRDRAVKIEEATPDMHLYADFMTLDQPFEETTDSQEDWQKEDRARQKQIDELEAGLKGRLSKIERFDLHQKLYTDYLAREVFLRTTTTRAYLNKWDAYLRGEIEEEPYLDLMESENQIFKAIGHLRSLIGAYKTHPRLHQVVFELARNLCRINNDNSRFYFRQFERRFMKTDYKNDFLIAQGDCLNQTGKPKEATETYLTLMQDKSLDDGRKSYVAYRLGWIYLGAALAAKEDQAHSNFVLAERHLKSAVTFAEADGQERLSAIKDRALKDLAWIFAMRNQTRQATAYYKNQDEEEYLAYYLYRAAIKEQEAGRHPRALTQLTLLEKKFKDFPLLPFAYLYMIDSYESLNQFKPLTQALKRFALIVDDDHPWYESQEDNEAFVAEVRKKVKFVLHQTAEKFEAFANDQKKPEYLAYATSIYTTYLKTFSEAEDFIDTKFVLGSLLFELKKMKQAATVFAQINDDVEDNNKYKRDSHFNEILALTFLAEDIPKPVNKTPNKPLKEEIELPAIKERLVDRMNEFVEKYYPDDKDSMPMRFSVAQIYMDYGYYEDALEHLEEIALEYPDKEVGQSALKTIAAHYSSFEQWPEFREKVLEFLDKPQFLVPETNKMLNTYLSEADKMIQAIESKKAQQAQLKLQEQKLKELQKAEPDAKAPTPKVEEK